ncbi:FCS-Like Zinc finger 2-like [Hordeum vulgare subsp. vulgare]|nr:FCS-Like Zinc finger 2-like [Hordeum vulgare subsp. vulgare]
MATPPRPSGARYRPTRGRTGPQYSDGLAASVPTHHIYPQPSPSSPSPTQLIRSLSSSSLSPHPKQQALLIILARKSPTHTYHTMAASAACSFFFFDAEPLGEPGMPAQDACALCTKPLARDSDVFMYKGDTPFCSEECRDEQMQLDAISARQAARRQQRFSSATEARRGQQESRKVSVAS